MVRVRSVLSAHRRKKRVLKKAKGQFGHRSKRFRQAKKSLIKGLTYAFRDRKAKKRSFRRLWTVRINAACRKEGITYSRFIDGLSKADIQVNRKMIAELAVNSPVAFGRLIEVAKKSQSQIQPNAAP